MSSQTTWGMNDHKAGAEIMLEYSGDMNPEVTGERAMHAAALAQVHATLYLAEQQRVANLIAAIPIMGDFGAEQIIKYHEHAIGFIATLTETEKS